MVSKRQKLHPYAEGIVLQYEARLQDGLDCGGAYLKFVTADDSFSPEGLNGDTPYTVMFGPDKCGGTNKVGRCKLDPSLKATCFQPLNLRVHTVLST